MTKKYLVINCGSSSLKFSLYEMPNEFELANGYIEKIGYLDSFWTIKYNDKKIEKHEYLKSHIDAVNVMIKELIDNFIINDLSEIVGVGHRILHGGEFYNDSVLITNEILKNINSLINLGPLHLPSEIDGIKAIEKCMPNVKQVAVFDTAFHQTMPKENYLYAVNYEWYLKYGVRRYGFHGISHRYITEVMQNKMTKKDINLIICHVGSGASITAVKDGKCFDTSMGLTPLDGLIMGSRSGEVDPSIIKYMCDNTNMSLDEVMNALNKESGLLGICGKNDFRDVCELKKNNDELAIIAYKMFIDSIIKHIAEYYFELEGNVDALVFTAGILSNNMMIREDLINLLSNPMGILLDKDMNNSIGYNHELKEGIITTKKSKIPVYVIPTNEELMIARDSYRIIN